jgi:hypothetical protein
MEQYNAAMQLATFCIERARLLREILSQGAVMRRLKLELISMDEQKGHREDIYKNDEDWINKSEMKELWSKVGVFSTEKCALEIAVQEEGNNHVADVLKHGPKAQVKEPDIKCLQV